MLNTKWRDLSVKFLMHQAVIRQQLAAVPGGGGGVLRDTEGWDTLCALSLPCPTLAGDRVLLTVSPSYGKYSQNYCSHAGHLLHKGKQSSNFQMGHKFAV